MSMTRRFEEGPASDLHLSRRQILAGAATAIVALKLQARPEHRSVPQRPRILTNHLGFMSGAAKYLTVEGAIAQRVTIRKASHGALVLELQSVLRPSDFAGFTSVDASALREAGNYIASLDDGSSADFVVDDAAYLPAIASACDYFQAQRCGHPSIGHHAPCHRDDGRRSDNQKHQDASGGWHDACDLRKWVDSTVYAIIGLGRSLEALGDAHPDRALALDEIRWGNEYFLKMQAPAGYVMRWCGGDDGNKYTNNASGDRDDRILDVEPCELPGQFQFIAAQALVGRLFAATDADYSFRCLKSAQECLVWCRARSPATCLSLAAGAGAAAQLFLSTKTPALASLAALYARELIRLQQAGADGGWFRARLDAAEPHRESQHGNLPLLALCDLLESLPAHDDAPRWRDALTLHVSHLEAMADRSAFGIVPYGLYSGTDPGGGRRVGQLWYRWFMRQRDETKDHDWWVGTNAHLASAGVGLARAAALVHDDRLTTLAQRQADWILGANPFGASLMTGFGKNQPRLYRAGTFSPPTPSIVGGVVNGIGGDELDNPALTPGSWQNCEYWTPTIAMTHWLLSELNGR